MFRPWELFVGFRYLRAKRQNQFVSFITLASMLGIAVGVAALIVVLSVMNGFENELRARLLSMTSHATVTGVEGELQDWRDVAEQALTYPGVEAAAPFVELQGMLANGTELSAAAVRGVLPAAEVTVSEVAGSMFLGDIKDLEPDAGGIVLGRILAAYLQVNLGDKVTLLVPRNTPGAGSFVPLLRRFEVIGVFEAGLDDHDAGLAFIAMEDAAAIKGLGAAVDGVRLKFDDIFRAPEQVRGFIATLSGDYVSSDWTRENSTYFRAIRIEKTMMSLILLLIVAVAVFNVVATLVMLVIDKQTEIAVLRTIGVKPGSVIQIFMIQGVVVGWLGATLGVALGVLVAFNVETIAPFLESLFGFEFMPADVYYVSRLPSDVHGADVAGIGLTAFVLSVLATIYPARRAAQTDPAEALRYD